MNPMNLSSAGLRGQAIPLRPGEGVQPMTGVPMMAPMLRFFPMPVSVSGAPMAMAPVAAMNANKNKYPHMISPSASGPTVAMPAMTDARGYSLTPVPYELIRSSTAAVAPHQRHHSPSPSAAAVSMAPAATSAVTVTSNQPLDLSMKAKLPIPKIEPREPKLAAVSPLTTDSTDSLPLDLSKKKTSSSSGLPTHPVSSTGWGQSSSSSTAGSIDPYSDRKLMRGADSMLPTSSATNSGHYSQQHNVGTAAESSSSSKCLVFHCKRCPFFCSDTVDFQRHFTQLHGSMPLMDEVVVVSHGERPTPPPALPTKQEALSSPKYGGARLHCTYCGWQCEISQSDLFSRHLHEHTNDIAGSYRCYHCNKEFTDPILLREHLSSHRSVYHYICTYCSVALPTEGNLVAHMSVNHSSCASSHQPPGSTPLHLHNGSSSISVGSGNSGSGSSAAGGSIRMGTVGDRMMTHSSSSVDSPISLKTNREASHVASPSQRANSTGSPTNSRPGSRPQSVPETLSPRPQSTAPLTPVIKTGFGQSLAKQIEAAISRELISNKSPNMGDLMFMRSGSDEENNSESEPVVNRMTNGKNSPLNLMTILDKVVEESLRSVPRAGSIKPEKPNLKFMVTFSDDEECSTDSNSPDSKANKKDKSNGRESHNSAKSLGAMSASKDKTDNTEALVSSSDCEPLPSASDVSSNAANVPSSSSSGSSGTDMSMARDSTSADKLLQLREATPSKDRTTAVVSASQETLSDKKLDLTMASQSKQLSDSYSNNTKELKRVHSDSNDSNDSSSSSEKRLKIDDDSD